MCRLRGKNIHLVVPPPLTPTCTSAPREAHPWYVHMWKLRMLCLLWDEAEHGQMFLSKCGVDSSWSTQVGLASPWCWRGKMGSPRRWHIPATLSPTQNGRRCPPVVFFSFQERKSVLLTKKWTPNSHRAQMKWHVSCMSAWMETVESLAKADTSNWSDTPEWLHGQPVCFFHLFEMILYINITFVVGKKKSAQMLYTSCPNGCDRSRFEFLCVGWEVSTLKWVDNLLKVFFATPASVSFRSKDRWIRLPLSLPILQTARHGHFTRLLGKD